MPDSPILLDLPDAFLGEKVLIRPWEAGDGAALYDAVQESLDHLLPWLPWGPGHDSEEASELMVREWHARWQLREDVPWAIWSLDETRLYGGTGLHRMDWHVGSFEIGYWVRASEHGKGYVTDAVKTIACFAFEWLSANRVFIRCAEKNTRSNAIPIRLGFVQEGVMRNNIKDADGNLHHANLYSLIPEEYRRLEWSQSRSLVG